GGHIYAQRVYGNVQVTDDADAGLGYSVRWSEGLATVLHGLDARLRYLWPMSYRRTKVDAEVFVGNVRERHIDPWGMLVSIDQTLSRYWSVGTRYDWSEYADAEEHHAWALGAFVTYFLTEGSYIRVHGRRTAYPRDRVAHTLYVEFVFGLGPHSHRLSD
ncbi:MAG: hypothetical protein JXP34_17685, partial [Planctomycetes bacterium]|nr:hypothetical protein [Planctomycetota bacterium]